MKKRLAVVSTHPIQYQTPVYRRLATSANVELHVFYASDHSIRGGKDLGFGLNVSWDIPLLEGYDYSFVGDLPQRQQILNRFFGRVHDALSKGGFDAVLMGAYTPMWMLRAIVSATSLKLPMLLRAETTDVALHRNWGKRKIRQFFLMELYKKFAVLLPIGANSREHYLAHGVPPGKMEFSPYCVDNSFFRSEYERWLPRRKETRHDLGFGADTFVVLFSGKLIAKKDPLTLLRAVASVRANTGLLVVGDGELRNDLQESALSDLRHRCVFVGFQNQTAVGKFYSAADVLVLPSVLGETWGMVVNEAMNFGLPVIVSDRVGCAPDLVLPGDTGFVFPAGNAHALSRQLEWMASEPARLSEMGRLARLQIAHYDVDQAVEGILRALDRTLSVRTVFG